MSHDPQSRGWKEIYPSPAPWFYQATKTSARRVDIFRITSEGEVELIAVCKSPFRDLNESNAALICEAVNNFNAAIRKAKDKR